MDFLTIDDDRHCKSSIGSRSVASKGGKGKYEFYIIPHHHRKSAAKFDSPRAGDLQPQASPAARRCCSSAR
jgi:hypothetical protein